MYIEPLGSRPVKSVKIYLKHTHTMPKIKKQRKRQTQEDLIRAAAKEAARLSTKRRKKTKKKVKKVVTPAQYEQQTRNHMAETINKKKSMLSGLVDGSYSIGAYGLDWSYNGSKKLACVGRGTKKLCASW